MEELTYHIVRSARKTTAIQILPDGQVVVRCNYWTPIQSIRRFVAEKESWIRKHAGKKAPTTKLTQQQLQELAGKAKGYIPERVAFYAPLVGVTYGGITIRNQKTRWGSCSGKGNLNFNCMLMLAPASVIDYVVIHELCHRKEMNHSHRFWALVQQHCPGYLQARQWLKANGNAILSQIP